MSRTAYIVHSSTTALVGLQRGGYHVISLFSEWSSRGFRGGGGTSGSQIDVQKRVQMFNRFEPPILYLGPLVCHTTPLSLFQYIFLCLFLIMGPSINDVST